MILDTPKREFQKLLKCSCKENSFFLDEVSFTEHYKNVHSISNCNVVTFAEESNNMSHFFLFGELYLNQFVNKVALKKLYCFEEGKEESWFICSCGTNNNPSLFFSTDDYMNHILNYHSGKSLPGSSHTS